MGSGSVAVLGDAVDAEIARAVVGGLRERGIDAQWRGPTDGGSARIVLLSGVSASSPSFLSEAVAGAPVRMIPVAVGAVPGEGLPDELSSLNWIF